VRFWHLGVLVGLAICGCARSPTIPKIETLPVKGTVTLDGKPLAGAIVIFMTVDTPAAYVGTTKEDGTYELQGPEGRAASLKGHCQVTASRMVKPDGSPLAPGELPAIVGAVEQLSPKYASLEATTLSANVDATGGTFDFPLTAN
jgi:hypothetical protein